MGRYRKIDTRIWNDAKFRNLGERSQLVFLFGLTHPNMTMLGAMRTTIPGLAAEYGHGVTEEAFREAFREAFAKGMANHDEKACFLWFPNFLKYNKPESPNVVRSWPEAFDMLPECAMKAQLFQHLKDFIEGLSEAFREAFREAFAKGMANQEQEQEQEYISPSATPPTENHPPSVSKAGKPKVPASVLREIYDAYPRHVGKPGALKAINKAIAQIAPSRDAAWLLERTRTYAEQRRGQDEKFTPHPATWFNSGRYDDEELDGSASAPLIWVDADGNQIGGGAVA